MVASGGIRLASILHLLIQLFSIFSQRMSTMSSQAKLTDDEIYVLEKRLLEGASKINGRVYKDMPKDGEFHAVSQWTVLADIYT